MYVYIYIYIYIYIGYLWKFRRRSARCGLPTGNLLRPLRWYSILEYDVLYYDVICYANLI